MPSSDAIAEVVRCSDGAKAIPSRIFDGWGDVAVEERVIYGREGLQMPLGRHLIAGILERSRIAAERSCSDPAMNSML